MMHSLPFKRSSHYASHCFAGFVLLIMPAVLNSLIMILLNYLTVLGSFYTLPKIFTWLGLNIFFCMFFYCITVFVGMFTGSSVAQIVFTYIIQILPIGFYVLLKFSLEQLLFGFGEAPYSLFIEDNHPLFFLLNGALPRNSQTVGYFLAYIISAAAFLVLGWFVYKYRRLETAGDIIAFPALYPVFKYGMTFCLMLVGGTYFCGVSRQSLPMLIVGYVIASALGYFVAEILIHKSFKVLHFYKAYLYYFVVIVILLGGLSLDVSGFVKRVPSPEEVEKVYFGYNYNDWFYFEKEKNPEFLESRYHDGGYFENNPPILLESQENIAGVIELQKHLIKERKRETGSSRYIIYTLKNGDYIIRQYEINEADQKDTALLKPIYESLEYKQLKFPAISLVPDDIKLMTVRDDRSGKRPVNLTGSKDIRELTELLKNEMIKMSYKDMTSSRDSYIWISVLENNKSNEQNILVRSSFTSLLNWLKDKGYYDQFALHLEDIESVELKKADSSIYSGNAATRSQVTINEREVIEELFNIDPSPDYNSNEVIVRFNVRINVWEKRVSLDTGVSEKLKGYFEELEEDN
jgi:ABC-2 type transport system permease protein